MKIDSVMHIIMVAPDGGYSVPAVKFADEYEGPFTPESVAAFCVCVADAFIQSVKDEQHQAAFENEFKEKFMLMLDNRHDYMEKVEVA
jgi:hypothetical protein